MKAEADISAYILLNWMFCLGTFAWLCYIYHRRRYLMIKPSILLLTLSHLFYQWPLALHAKQFVEFLPDPFIFAFLIQGYMILGILISSYSWHAESRMLWNRITTGDLERGVRTRAVFWLSSLVALIAVVYLQYVPFSSTGLYSVLFDPSNATMAREYSLKLLTNKFLAYAYSIMVSSLAPLVSVMIAFLILKAFRIGDWPLAGFYIVLLGGILVAVSFPGARISAVNLLLVIFFALILKKGIPFSPFKLIGLILLILTPAVLIGIFREGKTAEWQVYLQFLSDLVVRRILTIPIEVGSWFVHYSQTEGFFGVAAIPKLAALFGSEPINVPNVIGILYATGGKESTISAGAGYLLTYYSYFGILSLALSLVGLWFLDIAILVYRNLSDAFLLPCMAAISISTLSFISSDYTTVWLTHGFGVVLIISLLLDRFAYGSEPKTVKRSMAV